MTSYPISWSNLRHNFKAISSKTSIEKVFFFIKGYTYFSCQLHLYREIVREVFSGWLTKWLDGRSLVSSRRVIEIRLKGIVQNLAETDLRISLHSVSRAEKIGGKLAGVWYKLGLYSSLSVSLILFSVYIYRTFVTSCFIIECTRQRIG